jgi:hypothetical protein
MKKMLLAVLTAATFATSANAALISVDDATHGVGALTRDTATGLDWLDLSLTYNRSYSSVTSQLGSGGQFAGFRGATAAEVQSLMVNAGLPVSTQTTTISFDPVVITAANALTALIGDTLSGTYGSYYHGGRGSVFDDSAYDSIRMVGYYTMGGAALFNDYFDFGDYGNAGNGVWLVRAAPEAVPEPAMLGMFGLGLIGLAVRRRRRAA